MDPVESMEEDFTGFDEEEAILAPSGAIIDMPSKLEQVEQSFNETQEETDSDSGNLVIAEPQKKQETKVSEKSPRKRKPKVEDTTPTRARSSRVKGQGLAFLIAMEKGGSKKQMAKAQAQIDAQDASIAAAISSTELFPQFAPPMHTEPVKEFESENKKIVVKEATTKLSKEMVKTTKEKDPVKQLKEKDVRREKEASKSPLPTISNVHSPQVNTSKATGKSSSSNRKSFAAVNISSPLLKEPFKEGGLFSPNLFLLINFSEAKNFKFSINRLFRMETRSCIPCNS
jgi:hypothetical protein